MDSVMDTWKKQLLPDYVDESTYDAIVGFWSCFGRTPKDYFKDMDQQWSGKVKNDQYVWVDPEDGTFPTFPRFSVQEIAGWKKGKFIHCWNNIAKVFYPDGTKQGISCGGSLFSRNADLINAPEEDDDELDMTGATEGDR